MALRTEGEPCALCGVWLQDELYHEHADGTKLCPECAGRTTMNENEKANDKERGGLRKISGAEPAPCMHPEHEPPMFIVLEPGVYEHTCPGCGRKVVFTVPGIGYETR